MLVAGRREGKTTKTIRWLLEGHAIDRYPGWSRVIVTATEHEARRLRKEYALQYHQVYSVRDWTGRYQRGFAGVEVALEDADRILYDIVGNHRLGFVTITGVPSE